MKQIHKKFNTQQVKELFSRYSSKELTRASIQETLDVSKSHFFKLMKQYRQNPQEFNIKYERAGVSKLTPETESLIKEELRKELALIENSYIPVSRYNYMSVGRKLSERGITVSVPTIRERAKKWGFHIEKSKFANARTIESESVGEIIHINKRLAVFAPASQKEWYLTTITDDYSRFILSSKLTETEDAEENIKSLKNVFNTYGLPKSYYDIFVHFEEARVLSGYRISAICPSNQYLLFAEDRAYKLLLENLVRECVEKNVTEVVAGQKILDELVKRNNYHLINSISQEPPYLRFKNGNEVWHRI